ncbi:hypothetical protein BKA61DRAFT_702832 [Leptodontidium sp. MPI-SDFR-AT-0119]|nr:hypothetical protein BKA61DRAFT_702832 [Leptodontidium sp. MPI-SDFR-AT-0119]
MVPINTTPPPSDDETWTNGTPRTSVDVSPRLEIFISRSFGVSITQRTRDLPVKVLGNLSSEQLDIIRVCITHFYHQHPFMEAAKNDLLILFACYATIDDISRVLGSWAASDDGSDFYQLLVEQHKDSQTMGQLVSSLATLLGFNQLMPNTSNITPSVGRSHLDDFDAHMRGAALTNKRSVLEHMARSLVQAVEASGCDHQETILLLLTLLHADDTNDTDPYLLRKPDESSILYWSYKLRGLGHDDGFGWAQPLEYSAGVSTETGGGWKHEGNESF